MKSAQRLPPVFVHFIAEKRALAEAICKKHDQKLPSQAVDFFVAAQKGDWATTSNLFFRLEAENHPPSGGWSPPPFWGTIHDTYGMYELVEAWNPDLLQKFGQEIVDSIPSGSIYFGGTESGRFAVFAYCQSHTEGRPFFTLTQNALSDPAYRGYLSDMYGGKIYIPSTNDIGKCIEEYKNDAQTRLEHNQLRRGEDVRMVDGKVQFNGQIAVMAIHALITKLIFDKNPNREFYVEESFPLDWMYPHLMPHQFIFKLNREPLKEISPEIVRADREFWIRQTDAWLGSWLKTNTTVVEITNFADRVYVRNDLKEFKGNPGFIRDADAQKAFSKLRCAIAGLYAWRATNTKDPSERQRMQTEADFAFRQAFAICPSSPEVVFRYVDLLMATDRVSDAVRVASIGSELYPEYPAMKDLVEQLRRIEAQREWQTK